MKYSKDQLTEMDKSELLKLASEAGKPVNNTFGVAKLVSIILSHQANSGDTEELQVLGNDELTQALERVKLLEAQYAKKILEMDIKKGIEPSDQQLQKYSKEKAEYESVQLKLREYNKMSVGKRNATLKKEVVQSLVRINVSEIHPMQEAKDIEQEVLLVSWGNTAVGYHTTKVPMNTDWHVPVGCYRNLLNAMVIRTTQPKKGTMVASFTRPAKRFDIRVLDPLTETEIKEIAEKQSLMRTAGMSI